MEEKITQILYKNNVVQPLKGFCTTIEEGSILKASERLHLTQATVTRQIQMLERELGEVLFDRKGKIITPNQKALRFYESAVKVLNSVENLFHDFLETEKIKESNTIKIAAHHGIIAKILPNFIKNFYKQNKKIEFALYNISKEEALIKLKNGEVDIIIYPEIQYEPFLCNKVLFKSKPMLVLPQEHKLARKKDNQIVLQDIVSDEFISLSNNAILNSFRNLLIGKHCNFYIKLFNCDWDIVQELSKLGMGITGVFDFFIDKCDNLVYKDLSHIIKPIEIFIAIKKCNFIPENLENFILFMKDDFFTAEQ